ncbi:hypothetical protein [Aquipuribacter sp. SD81]|uniref:hypothetical protein n=1 Tax=Aquipuribacter sp. SD81 TaxID=3127703 RepID=UPI0030169E0A
MTDTTRPLLRRLLDDAAMFPPGNAGPRDAVAARAMYEDSWFAPLLGDFVVRADRVPELLAALRLAGDDGPREPLPVAVVVPGGLDDVAAAVRAGDDPALRLAGVEVPLGAAAPDTVLLLRTGMEVPDGVALVVEPSPGLDPAATMPVLGEAGVHAKLRTGGVTSAGFPATQVVARFVREAVRAGVPFKATAGLHNALRHRDEDTGFEHHGFLNLLAGTAAALLHDADEDDVHRLVTATAPEPLLDLLEPLDEAQQAAVRAAFTSFGTCSTVEPVEDLAGLGLLHRPGVGLVGAGA